MGATIEAPFSAFVAWQFLRNERYHLAALMQSLWNTTVDS